ncbi:MAG: polyphosphate polymerase domain-containing protein [Coriobacteriales bacterium]|nr:polyphosphate polymerase domain-containing protein [Coriobacteriales bacterium]
MGAYIVTNELLARKLVEMSCMVQLTFKRYEIKYLLTNEQRDRLGILMDRFMVPDEWGPSTVCNVYYDTPSHLLVRRSAEHPDYKEKVRIRSYGVARHDDPVFVELKKKFDGVVYKRRCTMDRERAGALLAGKGDPQTQIERELDFTCRRYGGLVPSFFIAYDREAFYAPNDREFRMTFDRRVRSRTSNLRLDATDVADQFLEDGLNLLEVKAGGAIPLWLVEFLSGEGIRKVRFSKVGMAWRRQLEAELAMRRQASASHLASAWGLPYVSVPASCTLA